MKRRKEVFIAFTISAVILSSLMLILMWEGVEGKNRQEDKVQFEQKNVTKMQLPNEPFEIVDWRIKGEKAVLGKSFRAEGNWLKGLEFSFRNKTEKPITSILIDLDFPETKGIKPMIAYQIKIGQRPAPDGTLLGNPIFLLSKETIPVKLTDEECEKLERFLAKRGFLLTKLTRAHYRIREIFFSDESAWINGVNYVSDRNSPNGYRRVD